MRLRIRGNSLLFRISRSELSQLHKTGRLEETVYFSLDGASKLVYALEHAQVIETATLRYQTPEILILLSSSEVSDWIGSGRKGVYAAIDLGNRGELELLIEKDFELLQSEDDP